MHEDEKLVTVGEYENSFDADLAKLTLDNAGIQSVVLGRDLAANLTYNPAIFHIEIQVAQSDAEKARQVLAEESS